jgi:hypothetical protein
MSGMSILAVRGMRLHYQERGSSQQLNNVPYLPIAIRQLGVIYFALKKTFLSKSAGECAMAGKRQPAGCPTPDSRSLFKTSFPVDSPEIHMSAFYD